jgi:transglutaminase-like putative cysteine protease
VSLWRDDPRPSATTLAAIGGVALVAVGSLSRIFVGPRYLAWALPAVVIGAAFATIFGRRSLGIGFGILTVGWLLTLPAFFARSKYAGFPTATSIRAALRLIGSGLTEAPRAVPPLDPEARYMILVWTAMLFLGFLGAAWVVVRRPVGAVISALGIVTFAGSLGDGAGRMLFAGAAVAATIAFFLSEGRQRIEKWASRSISVPVWFGVPTLLAASGVALAAPFLLGEAPLVELRSAIRPRLVIIKPLTDIRRQLKVTPPLEVMRVESARATYWRLTSLDRYDGREWVLEAKPRPVRNGAVSAPTPPATGEFLEQRYRLTSLLSPWMPAAYAARSVDAPARVELDSPSQTLLLPDKDSPGLAYTVRSQLPNVPANVPAPPQSGASSYEKAFGGIARPIVAGSHTPLEAAQRLEAHFRAYTYDEDVAGGHSVARLGSFLRERAGYCEQFAATMTLMLRGLGIPARVAVGFLPGGEVGGEFVVSTREAHAWVEANIPGAGWTTFDPTPGRGNASAAPPEATSEPATPPPVPQETSVPASTPETQRFPEDVTEPVAGGIPAVLPWSILAVVVAAAIPVSKRVRRQMRRSGDPVAATLGAWAEFVDRGRELGWSPREWETHSEFTKRTAGVEDGHGKVLAQMSARALYGPPGTTNEEAAAAWNALHHAHGAMRSRAAWWRRVLAPVDPRTFLPLTALRRFRLRLISSPARG